MLSRGDRFWIKLILRLAFGLFFLFAAINIFNAGGATDFGPEFFAKSASKPFAGTWIADIPPTFTVKSGGSERAGAGVEAQQAVQYHWTYYFLYGLPYVFAGLSVPILTGIFLRPALRLGAILLILLGLGKYVTSGTDLTTTANDFFFAFLICVGLYFLGEEKKAAPDTGDFPV